MQVTEQQLPSATADRQKLMLSNFRRLWSADGS
jgi:hypothetical protein